MHRYQIVMKKINTLNKALKVLLMLTIIGFVVIIIGIFLEQTVGDIILLTGIFLTMISSSILFLLLWFKGFMFKNKLMPLYIAHLEQNRRIDGIEDLKYFPKVDSKDVAIDCDQFNHIGFMDFIVAKVIVHDHLVGKIEQTAFVSSDVTLRRYVRTYQNKNKVIDVKGRFIKFDFNHSTRFEMMGIKKDSFFNEERIRNYHFTYTYNEDVNRQYKFVTNDINDFEFYFDEDISKAFASFVVKAETQDLKGQHQNHQDFRKAYELERKRLQHKVFMAIQKQSLYLFISYGNQLTFKPFLIGEIDDDQLEHHLDEAKNIIHFAHLLSNKLRKNTNKH